MLVAISLLGQMKKTLVNNESMLRSMEKNQVLFAGAGRKNVVSEKARNIDFGCVTLTEPGFQAVKNGAEIDFIWSSLSENNCREYAIQCSADGQNFETIEVVKATGISGQMTNYSETEFTPQTGTAMYRLMISSNDGQIRFSTPVTVCVQPEDIENESRNYNYKDSVIAQKYGINDSEVLLVLRDSHGIEQYSKFMMLVQDKRLIAVDIQNRVNPGKYLIIATSNNRIYGKKVWVK
jgi:predicted protein tyrosine phosphatase